MAYDVLLTEKASADASSIYEWVVDRAPHQGAIWFSGLMETLRSLETLPYRCPLARENYLARLGVRCLHFGKRKHVHRILYVIDESKRTVTILHIRHGALPEQGV